MWIWSVWGVGLERWEAQIEVYKEATCFSSNVRNFFFLMKRHGLILDGNSEHFENNVEFTTGVDTNDLNRLNDRFSLHVLTSTMDDTIWIFPNYAWIEAMNVNMFA